MTEARVYLVALGICIVAAAAEGLCAGRDPMGQLRRLRQPSWAPPSWLWVLIGLAWYAINLAALVRLLPLWPDHRSPVIMLCALLLANGAANIVQFRARRLDLAFFFLIPYGLLLAAFLWMVCRLDQIVCMLFVAYAAYLVYAAAWTFRVWRMNS